MSMRGRELTIGDHAFTDFNGNGMVRVVIVDEDRERRNGHSQSGIMFRVSPPLKGGTTESWYCSDWFEPVPKTLIEKG